MIPITSALLADLAPQGNSNVDRKAQQKTIIDTAAPALQEQCTKAGIDTMLRAAHFLAQICMESDGFCTAVEYASGAAYEGRRDLGNTQPGDGVRFKGRGLIMITGRANYARYGHLLNLPLLETPALAADPVHAVAIAIEFWTAHGLNTFADKDDIRSITRRINGGLNGLLARQLYLTRAKRQLAPPAPSAPAAAIA